MLATQLVRVLRYKRHHCTAKGMSAPQIAEEFMLHANEEAAHGVAWPSAFPNRVAPDFSPDSLSSRSHAAYDDSLKLRAMIKASLVAERVAVECYSQMIGLIRDRDSTTHCVLEEILANEQKHADELKDWLAD